MNKDLDLSAYVFGWGAGIFFLGYFLFEVPSNVILGRTGARIWIARIMITGGRSALLALATGHRTCRQAGGEQGAVLPLLRGAHCVQTRDVSTFADMEQRVARVAHREGFSGRGARIVITPACRLERRAPPTS
jgi:hypothetical protein